MKSNPKIKCLLLLIIVLLLISVHSKGQNPLPPIDVSITIENGNGFCSIELPDTINVASVEVQLENTANDSLVYSQVFIYDQTSGLPNGNSWQRQGVNVDLGLGYLPDFPGWRGRVKLQNNSGLWSSPFEFIFQ